MYTSRQHMTYMAIKHFIALLHSELNGKLLVLDTNLDSNEIISLIIDIVTNQ